VTSSANSNPAAAPIGAAINSAFDFGALVFGKLGDVIEELTSLALLDQVVQHCRARISRRGHKHFVRTQGPFDACCIHAGVITGLAGIVDLTSRE
jgi:hypothetical protein